jgi:hypothetical protein
MMDITTFRRFLVEQKPVEVSELLAEIQRIREICPDIEADEFIEERLGSLTDVADFLCNLLAMADQLRGEE